MTATRRLTSFVLLASALLGGCSALTLRDKSDPCASTRDPAQAWCAITFGQSADLNFASTILPAKIGTNTVFVQGQALRSEEPVRLPQEFVIESRGGKLANAHDGLSFFYTRLPTRTNFALEAEVFIEQFGPENDSATNRQEALGLMVRDVNGPARLVPMRAGYEEFPAAANMVATAVMAEGRNKEGRIEVAALARDGVRQPWGNADSSFVRNTLQGALNWKKAPLTLRLGLERTDEGFFVSIAEADGSNLRREKVEGINPGSMQVIEPGTMAVGFFAARNARVVFRHARLSTSPARAQPTPRYAAPAEELAHELASPATSASAAYVLQGRSTRAGTLSVSLNGAPAGTLAVAAGPLYQLPLTLAAGENRILARLLTASGESDTEELLVTRLADADTRSLYAAPDGRPDAAGTREAPLDFASATARVAPGGTVWLLDGIYRDQSLPLALSGLPTQPKALRALNPGKARFTGRSPFRVSAYYWHLADLEFFGVPGNGIRIPGSHNVFERIISHSNKDSGLQISPDTSATPRPFRPAHNLVADSESFLNIDDARINADGFAAKLGLGEGNVFRRCIAHHNADDGWDLFNKLEDGANAPVLIEDSIAYANGVIPGTPNPAGSVGNGFKLGGEGLPVAHVLRRNLAFDNNMDGFTDNFNPGALRLEDNVAFNNARFNFIFRPGPYAKPGEQGVFLRNASLRTAGRYPAGVIAYGDAVTGRVEGSNYFFSLTGMHSVNGAGTPLDAGSFQTLIAPLRNDGRIARNADGSIRLEGFLQRR